MIHADFNRYEHLVNILASSSYKDPGKQLKRGILSLLQQLFNSIVSVQNKQKITVKMQKKRERDIVCPGKVFLIFAFHAFPQLLPNAKAIRGSHGTQKNRW